MDFGCVENLPAAYDSERVEGLHGADFQVTEEVGEQCDGADYDYG
jgi:hypothetical protein